MGSFGYAKLTRWQSYQNHTSHTLIQTAKEQFLVDCIFWCIVVYLPVIGGLQSSLDSVEGISEKGSDFRALCQYFGEYLNVQGHTREGRHWKRRTLLPLNCQLIAESQKANWEAEKVEKIKRWSRNLWGGKASLYGDFQTFGGHWRGGVKPEVLCTWEQLVRWDTWASGVTVGGGECRTYQENVCVGIRHLCKAEDAEWNSMREYTSKYISKSSVFWSDSWNIPNVIVMMEFLSE